MNLEILEINLVTGTFWASLISFILFLFSVVNKKKDAQKAQITSILGYVGMIFTFITSTAALVAKAIVSGHVPWSNFYESMVLMTSLSTILFLVIHRMYKNDLLGVVMSPGISLLIGITSILPRNFRGNDPLVPALQSYWIKIHTTAMIVSYSVFLLSTTTAIAYLVLLYLHNKKKQGSLAKEVKLSLASTGPAIADSNVAMVMTETLSNNDKNRLGAKNETDPQVDFFDDLTYKLILFGFPILAFGIITGAMWANHAWGTYWSWDPKETASLMTWLFYGAYIHSRIGMNIRGKTSAILAILGFVAVIFTYYGVNYLPGLHSYGFSVEN
ncbi:MAG: c-type cytochrome biogenesis protein CcsB [Candidatus Sericytochromatia bacterium]